MDRSSRSSDDHSHQKVIFDQYAIINSNFIMTLTSPYRYLNGKKKILEKVHKMAQVKLRTEIIIL